MSEKLRENEIDCNSTLCNLNVEILAIEFFKIPIVIVHYVI